MEDSDEEVLQLDAASQPVLEDAPIFVKDVSYPLEDSPTTIKDVSLPRLLLLDPFLNAPKSVKTVNPLQSNLWCDQSGAGRL